jgi:hypothetical protein
MSMRKNCLLVPADHVGAPPTSYAAPTDAPVAPIAPTAPTDGSLSSDEGDAELDDLCQAALQPTEPSGRTRYAPDNTDADFDKQVHQNINVGDRITAELVATCERDMRCARRRLDKPAIRDAALGLTAGKTEAGHKRVKIKMHTRDLFAFFMSWKRQEHKRLRERGNPPSFDGNRLFTEFHSFNGTQKYYWTHMYELFSLYKRQQLALRSPASSKADAALRQGKLMVAFFHLDLSQQRLLVDDWIIERTARSKQRHAAQLETCLARKTLAKIKADLVVLGRNIDYVLRHGVDPHPWQGAFEGI